MMKRLLYLILIWLIGVGLYQSYKPLPEGLSTSSPIYQISSDQIRFLNDTRYQSRNGEMIFTSEIFEAMLAQINNAESLIVADFFLINEFNGRESEPAVDQRQTSQMLIEALIAKKQSSPQMLIILTTDPINTVYGGLISEQFQQLKDSGITVFTTDVSKLRDSNPIYSSVWRSFIQWFGNEPNVDMIDNPMQKDGQKVSIRSLLSLLNFKANHRKILVTDGPDGLTSLITSANPHSASSIHNNVAFQVDGLINGDILKSERSVQAFSDNQLYDRLLAKQLDLSSKALLRTRDAADNLEGSMDISVQFQTESKIRDQLVEWIDTATYGDEISIAQFYVSERRIIKRLVKAASRGVTITMVLDPNKDAFGIEKSGIPNRNVASELRRKGNGRIRIRWYDTNGEQFHSKLFLWIDRSNNLLHSSLGSANLTSRNLKNYNLEANLALSAPLSADISKELVSYFEGLWGNQAADFTLPYENYANSNWFSYWRYRFMEATGLSTF